MTTEIIEKSDSMAVLQHICPNCQAVGQPFTTNENTCTCQEITRSVGGTTAIDEFFHQIMEAAECGMEEFAPNYNRCDFLTSSHVSAKADEVYFVEIAFNGVITDHLTDEVEIDEPAATIWIDQFTSNGTLTLCVAPSFNTKITSD